MKNVFNSFFLSKYFLDLVSVGLIFYILLIIASLTAKIMSVKYNNSTINNLQYRINSWWLIIIVLTIICLLGNDIIILFFLIISFFSLKEIFIVFNLKDKIVLYFCLYIIIPLQYLLIYIKCYQWFIILIPVYSFLLIPVLILISKNINNYLERISKVQYGLMISVFCLSYLPALSLLEIKGFENRRVFLIIFLIIISQVNDTLQYIFGKLLGNYKIVPNISPNKTLEGYLGGLLGTSVIAICFYWITPFNKLQTFFISIIICLMGNIGGLVMSSIKRDCKVKDWGSIIKGHGGITDRIDSICFSAPVFFYIVKYYWA